MLVGDSRTTSSREAEDMSACVFKRGPKRLLHSESGGAAASGSANALNEGNSSVLLVLILWAGLFVMGIQNGEEEIREVEFIINSVTQPSKGVLASPRICRRQGTCTSV